jgi:deoxyribonuclease V
MKLPAPLHHWDLTPKQAVAVQRELAHRICISEPAPNPVRLVAGCDAAFTDGKKSCIAGVVVWDFRKKQIVEQQTVVHPVSFPYVPGLLTFREAPALLAAIVQLRESPDVFLFDGQGFAHPRRMGLACHVGLFIDRPSIGCAKSRLTGIHQTPKLTKGGRKPLMDGTERIGTVLRTRDNVQPIFVSAGHKINLAEAERIVLQCATRYRLPEPTRLADRLVAETKKARTRMARTKMARTKMARTKMARTKMARTKMERPSSK